jgi:CO/xanthine dehydrogenase FAD-binding subunit
LDIPQYWNEKSTIGSIDAAIGFSDRQEIDPFDLDKGPPHTLRAARLPRRTALPLLASAMKPAPFKYVAATSLEQALSLKAEYGDDASFLAGGQSLIPAMNFRLAKPAVLIDINRVGGLGHIRLKDDSCANVGALTRHRTLERDSAIVANFPLIAEALPHIAHPQIRNRGTLGGNLSHADPASELPAIAVALGARFRIQTISSERWCEARNFFIGALTTDLRADEMLTEVDLPLPRPRTGSCFMEIARRRGDFAIVGVAAMVTLQELERDECEDLRLTLCGVGETPIDASPAAASLAGHALTEDAICAIAASVHSLIEPSGNVHATADYQRHIAGVLAARALGIAHQRARNVR